MGFLSGIFGKGREKKPRNVNRPVFSGGAGSFQVQDVFKITGVGIVPVGKVLSGSISVGQTTHINGKFAMIKSIEMHHQQMQAAYPGDNVGICLDGVAKNDVQKGMILEFK